MNTSEEDKKIMEQLAGRELAEREVFDAKQDLLGFLALLLEVDKRVNPHLYKKNGGKTNTNSH